MPLLHMRSNLGKLPTLHVNQFSAFLTLQVKMLVAILSCDVLKILITGRRGAVDHVLPKGSPLGKTLKKPIDRRLSHGVTFLRQPCRYVGGGKMLVSEGSEATQDLVPLFGIVNPFFGHHKHLLSHKIGHTLYRAGAGEHVHRRHTSHPIARLDQHSRIPRQRSGIAGDVDQLLWRQGTEPLCQLS